MDNAGYWNLKSYCDSVSPKLRITINLRRSSSPIYGDYGVIIHMMAIKHNKSYFREIEIGVNADEREGICRIEIHTLGGSVIYQQNRPFPTLAIHPNQSPPFSIKLFQERIESEMLAFHRAVVGIGGFI